MFCRNMRSFIEVYVLKGQILIMMLIEYIKQAGSVAANSKCTQIRLHMSHMHKRGRIASVF